MNAFHSFWSAPNKVKHYGKIVFYDHELLAMILSALKWQEKNGSIRMITDSDGARFFEQNGLSHLWDAGISTELDRVDKAIDPVLFWAAGKLYALDGMPSPCVMLDTDMIIWTDIRARLADCIVAAHYEDLSSGAYPDPRTFHVRPEYQFPPEWDFRVKAANTAFLYMPSRDFKTRYVSAALEFMRGIDPDNMNPITAMCFAEQRILPMCAEADKLPLRYLLDVRRLDEQNFVTHLWGYKETLQRSAEQRERFCLNCIRRIAEDYPEYETILLENPLLKKYGKLTDMIS